MAQLYSEGDWFGVRFSPPAQAAGQRTSTVTITSNGGSPTVALTGICSIAACGGSNTSTKQPQNYTVTFTATTGSTKQTANFMLTGELGHAHDHVARSECTAKKMSLVKFTR
jgi:hypothetical protein